ncbi:MAG: hypothetical protein ACYCZO_10075 [Daejeonella sp.]
MLKPKFTSAQLRKTFEDRLKMIDTAIINRLQFIGETFVKNAREKTKEQGSFGDITGNLRSSIGYIVLRNGKRVSEDFELSERGSDRHTGLSAGKSYANEVKKKFGKGYVLICVAGMQYAAAVEDNGKDVITASSITAKNDLITATARFKRKVREL